MFIPQELLLSKPMLNKFTATVFTVTAVAATFPVFTAPTFAAAKVRVIEACLTYNDVGYAIKVSPDDYPLINYSQFQDGEKYAKILVSFGNKGIGMTNVPIHCLSQDGRRIIEY